MPKVTTTLLFRFLIVAAVTVNSTNAFALKAEGYFAIQRQIADLDSNSEISRAMLNRYLIGLAEAFGSIYVANSSRIILGGQDNVCAPGADAFTAELMEVAIQQQIGTFRNPRPLEKAALNIPLGAHAMLGLAKLFPCR